MRQVVLFFLQVYTPCAILQSQNIKLHFSLSQKIENEGFHRDILWLLEMHSPLYEWKKLDCLLALHLVIPNGMFVNPDEIAELMRMNKLFAYINGSVNIETPSYESDSHDVFVYVKNVTNKISLFLPIHLRYQRAQITGGFGKVVLAKPSILLSCFKENSTSFRRHYNILAPCSANLDNQCYWKNITYEALFDEAEMFVPIGDQDDYAIVSVVSLLVGCAGTIYILSILSSNPAL